MDIEISYQSLLIVMILAAIMPLILNHFKKINIPIVVGEIIAGIVIGESGFHWVAGNDLLISFLAEFGLVFLMFLAGMEIDISILKTPSDNGNKPRKIENPIIMAGLHFFFTLLLSLLVSFLLFKFGYIKNAWMMALILSTTSLGVVVPVLKEKNIIRTKFGQTVLIAALFADFATMLFITILVAILSKGMSFEILLIGLLFVAFFIVYRLGNLFFNRLKSVRVAIEELSHATTQIKVRIAIAIMLVLVALSEMIGSEIILGAFMAGVILRLISTPSDAHVVDQLETIGYGFFIPIFFIKVGAEINIPEMFASSNIGVLVPMLIISAIVVKVLPGLLFKFVYSWRETLGAGLLLASRLSLLIAAVAIGVKLDAISPQVQSVIILIAVFTVTIFPPFFNLFVPSGTVSSQRKYLIVGASNVGKEIAHQLLSHKEHVSILALADENINGIDSKHIKLFQLNTDYQLSDELKHLILNANSIICAAINHETNYNACKFIKKVNSNADILALLENPNAVARFKELGVNTFSWIFDIPAMIAAMIRNPVAYALLADANSDKEIFEIIVQNRAYFRKKIRDIHLPGDVLVISVRRRGETILPHGGTEINQGDSITIAGSKECLFEARELLS